MKKIVLIFVFGYLLLMPGRVSSQSVLDSVPILTPNGMFDIVYDQLGVQHALYNLQLGA